MTPPGCTWIRDTVVAVDVAGEFDRTGAITSSLPSFIDTTKPRRSAWAFDRHVLPHTYWHAILRGRL